MQLALSENLINHQVIVMFYFVETLRPDASRLSVVYIIVIYTDFVNIYFNIFIKEKIIAFD